MTVVDRNNHHLFQPLIYQVAAGALSAGRGRGADSLRCSSARQNATVLMAAVTDVDVERRQVVLDRGERLDYDSLIVACGGETSYFGHDEWAGGHVRAEDARRRASTCGTASSARSRRPSGAG